MEEWQEVVGHHRWRRKKTPSVPPGPHPKLFGDDTKKRFCLDCNTRPESRRPPHPNPPTRRDAGPVPLDEKVRGLRPLIPAPRPPDKERRRAHAPGRQPAPGPPGHPQNFPHPDPYGVARGHFNFFPSGRNCHFIFFPSGGNGQSSVIYQCPGILGGAT